MDTFAALALATDPATMASLDRKPDRKNAPLITVEMLKMILIQASYQIIVCLVLHLQVNKEQRGDGRKEGRWYEGAESYMATWSQYYIRRR